jgi:hypothetical protein
VPEAPNQDQLGRDGRLESCWSQAEGHTYRDWSSSGTSSRDVDREAWLVGAA